MEANLISVRDLEFSYPVGDFHLRVPEMKVAARESVALVGPSGCGKTTLINLLAGIQEAGSGRIDVAGLNISELAPEDRQVPDTVVVLETQIPVTLPTGGRGIGL